MEQKLTGQIHERALEIWKRLGKSAKNSENQDSHPNKVSCAEIFYEDGQKRY